MKIVANLSCSFVTVKKDSSKDRNKSHNELDGCELRKAEKVGPPMHLMLIHKK